VRSNGFNDGGTTPVPAKSSAEARIKFVSTERLAECLKASV
jgi:hypothetical protein